MGLDGRSSYMASQVSHALPHLFGILVRMEVLKWAPLMQPNITAMSWFLVRTILIAYLALVLLSTRSSLLIACSHAALCS